MKVSIWLDWDIRQTAED